MSLGGYKFAGYKCRCTSGMSDADLALLVHKTRLKAFVEACARANANWHFCKNSGSINFEENTGVIYSINSSSYNFVSFFQYENEDKYIAIVSVHDQSSIVFNDDSTGLGFYGTSSNKTIWGKRSTFHCASTSAFSDENFFRSGYTYPPGALPLIPDGAPQLGGSPFSSVGAAGTVIWLLKFTGDRDMMPYYGYAVKGDRIISIFTTSANSALDSSKSEIECGECFINIIGFDAMSLCSSSDTKNLFHTQLMKDNSSAYEFSFPMKNADTTINIVSQCLKSSGGSYSTRLSQSAMSLEPVSLPAYTYSASTYTPYGAMQLTTAVAGESTCIRSSGGTLLNTDGIATKGVIDIDLLASNITDGFASLNPCRPYANGNYLLAYKDFGGGAQIYCGWDASNPDITLDASWTAYNG